MVSFGEKVILKYLLVEIDLRFFPFLDEEHVMCDPWESAQLVRFMEHNIPTDQCNYCLPDCSRTIYQYTASAQPFRCKIHQHLTSNVLCKSIMGAFLYLKFVFKCFGRCQFHQHFTCTFFVPKCLKSFSLVTLGLVRTFVQKYQENIGKKAAS